MCWFLLVCLCVCLCVFGLCCCVTYIPSTQSRLSSKRIQDQATTTIESMGNATSITDQPSGISPEAFEALRNEYEAQKKVEPVLSGTCTVYSLSMLVLGRISCY